MWNIMTLESIDPSICISWNLSSSALEMLVPGHAVGNVMGRGLTNVDNIHKISEASVEISDNKSSCSDRVAVISGKPEQKRLTLKGLKRKDVQLLRKFRIQFKGGFENVEVGGDPKLLVRMEVVGRSCSHCQSEGPFTVIREKVSEAYPSKPSLPSFLSYIVNHKGHSQSFPLGHSEGPFTVIREKDCILARYHNLKDDDIMKNIFNSGRYKEKVRMKIPARMISEEMKHTEHDRMYAEVFGIEVPLTQSQPTKSTQGTHRIPSAPRSPNPNMDAGVSSALKRSTLIRFRIPQRRSTRLTPPALVPTVDKADEMILQDTLQVILAKHKSQEEQEARENVELVNKHLPSVEIEKMVEGPENVIGDSSIPRNDDQNIPATRLEPRTDKESPEVEITNDKEVEITNVVIPMNVNKEKEEITDEVYELKRKEKGKIVEESRSTPFPTPIGSPRINTDLVSSDTKKLQELTFLSRKSFDTLDDHLREVMVESLPTMVNKHIKKQVEKQVPEQVKVQVIVYVAKGLLFERQHNKEETDKMIAKAMLQERGKLQAIS
ncbi:retrovirus-related pol polyprotein from transposon TNT 1-94 [Tanacetum coccineum]